ncbi:MAG TPA: hypothetical protein VMF91_21690 [Bryobacteraceae bacterium]|nr:hypothetical protein [Bryobacteraceae bacterium]
MAAWFAWGRKFGWLQGLPKFFAHNKFNCGDLQPSELVDSAVPVRVNPYGCLTSRCGSHVVGEGFENSAIGDKAFSGTTALDAPQFGCKPTKVGYFAFNLLQMFLRYVIDPGTFFRIGPEWVHIRQFGVATNSVAGEAALDFMFWPSARHKFGWFLEPAYEYNFGPGHERSLGMSAGLLIGIP